MITKPATGTLYRLTVSYQTKKGKSPLAYLLFVWIYLLFVWLYLLFVCGEDLSQSEIHFISREMMMMTFVLHKRTML